jgi:uracil-DNA glycosylase family 4
VQEGIRQLSRQIVMCRRCPRLVSWREKVAVTKVRRFDHESYWGKPVPGFGDSAARLLIIGLAPAAHGANRTGRMFTGDRSGDWLYRALHKFRFASQAESVHRDDGMTLTDCYVTAAVRCAPPQNKPNRQEKENCLAFLGEEITCFDNVRVVIALGKLAFDATLKVWLRQDMLTAKRRDAFRHGAEIPLNERTRLLASYHPSQQNTFTGRLTEAMFDDIFARAVELLT